MARRTTTAASRSAVLSPDGGALPCSLRRMRRRRASTTHVMRRHPRTRRRRASMTRARRGGIGRRGGAETRRRAREAGAFVALVLVASNQHGDWMQFDRPSSSLSSSSPPCTKNNSLFLHVLHRRAWGKKFVLPRPLRSDSFDVEHLPNLLHLRPHSSSNPVAPIELATELHGARGWHLSTLQITPESLGIDSPRRPLLPGALCSRNRGRELRPHGRRQAPVSGARRSAPDAKPRPSVRLPLPISYMTGGPQSSLGPPLSHENQKNRIGGGVSVICTVL